MKTDKITLLAPMYTEEERWVANEIKKQLEQGGYPTYQPYTDGFEKQLFELLASNDDSTTPSEAKRAILLSSALNFYNIIKASDCCVLVMDGRTPDEGSVFWAAVAFASGKPVVLWKSDYRTFMCTGDNSMVTGLTLDYEPVKHITELNGRVASQIKKYVDSGKWKEECLPGYNKSLLLLGEKVRKERNGSSLMEIVEKLKDDPLVKTLIPDDEKELSDITGKVYCSGPLFCPSEIREMKEIAEATEGRGLSIYLPHRDGAEAMIGALDDSTTLDGKSPKGEAIKNHTADINSFTIDVYQLVLCENFVINLNGRVPDDGAVSEAGMAFAMGMPCVLYKSDSRTLFGGVHGFLHPALQMGGHLFDTTDKYKEIKDKLRRHAAFIKTKGNKYSREIHPKVSEVYGLGKTKADQLKEIYTGTAPISNPFTEWRFFYTSQKGDTFFKFWRQYHPYTDWPGIKIKSVGNNQYMTSPKLTSRGRVPKPYPLGVMWIKCKSGSPLKFTLQGEEKDCSLRLVDEELYLSYAAVTGAAKLFRNDDGARWELIKRGKVYNIRNIKPYPKLYLWVRPNGTPCLTRGGKPENKNAQWIIEGLPE